jgi:hypothetical protein
LFPLSGKEKAILAAGGGHHWVSFAVTCSYIQQWQLCKKMASCSFFASIVLEI